jgi:hypothetical protein
MTVPPAPGAEGAAEAALRLRPLAFGELLDEIFRIYRRHFGLLVAISLLLALPVLVTQIFGGQAEQLAFTAAFFTGLLTQSTAALAAPPQPNLLWYASFYLVTFLLALFTAGAVTLAAIEVMLGRPATLLSTLAGTLRRYLALLAQVLIYVLAVVPALLCLPVAAWIFIRWSVAVPALLAEGIGPVQALRRSWELTRGHWWRLFGILVVVYLLAYVVSSVLGIFALPLAILVPFVPDVVRGAVALTVTTLASALVAPIEYLCVVLLYFDLRVRKESFDLDQLAEAAAS